MKYPEFTGTEPCTEVGVENFYLPEGVAGWSNLKLVRALCGGCPMKSACLEWAIENFEPGFWGGTTDRERTAIRRERTINVKAATAA